MSLFSSHQTHMAYEDILQKSCIRYFIGSCTYCPTQFKDFPSRIQVP